MGGSDSNSAGTQGRKTDCSSPGDGKAHQWEVPCDKDFFLKGYFSLHMSQVPKNSGEMGKDERVPW